MAFLVGATAVCILLGPVFIPSFIVPQLDWLFWGWLKAFIQYSFYQVLAAGVLYIVSQITFGIIHAQITGLISPTHLIKISCTSPQSPRLSKSRYPRATPLASLPHPR